MDFQRKQEIAMETYKNLENFSEVNTLHQLLKWGLDDMGKCIRDGDRYMQIQPGTHYEFKGDIHVPGNLVLANGHVADVVWYALPGAVIAKSFNGDRKSLIKFSDYGNRISRRLHALYHLERGRVVRAYRSVYIGFALKEENLRRCSKLQEDLLKSMTSLRRPTAWLPLLNEVLFEQRL